MNYMNVKKKRSDENVNNIFLVSYNAVLLKLRKKGPQECD